MRLFASLYLLSALFLFAQSSEEKEVLAATQKTFDGIAAHDGAMVLASTLPDARIYSVRNAGEPTITAIADFAKQIGTIKGELLERFTSPPKVSIQGRVAQVW